MTQFGLLIRTLLLSSVVYFALDVVRRSGDVSAPVRESLDELLSLGGMAGSSFDARGKTVLVTGASSGIGEALAYKYAALGAHVGLVARRAATLERVKTKCEALGGGGRITTLSADVGTEDGWELVRTHVERTMGGVLDFLVLGVGISMGSLFPDLVQANDAMRLTKKLMNVNFLE
jgi:short-subunit dehydrogenase